MNLVPKEIRNMQGQARVKILHLRNAMVALAALLALASIGNPAAMLAQESGYTAESLEGDYAFVGAYSGDVARLVGTAHFDGRGDLTSGSARVVIVGGAVKSISYSGQYTVNPDGTGTMTLSVFGVATPPPTVTLDFVISKARSVHGTKIATEIQDAQEGPSVVVPSQNSFVTHVFTRRPDREDRR
jgi:hypothetical protein